MAQLFAKAALLVAACCAVWPAAAAQQWVELPNCRLARNEANDADSFHVKAGAKEYIFRLYFVDAAETDESFPERVEEQAKYFGVTSAQALQLGKLAQQFTKEKLTQPFTVRTCMQDALGRSKKDRYYAFISTKDGDLAELLVANGLARVHGSEAKPVGLSSPDRMWKKLERLEREARAQKVGAWGAAVGRMTARLSKQPAKSGADSFDAFFHPERLAAPAEAQEIVQMTVSPTPAPTPAPTTTAASSLAVATRPLDQVSADLAPNGAPKLDINTASPEELKNLPGVGEVMAARIMAARPYESADFLLKVKGIGPKRYAKLRPYFR